jgi:hypothetical protein
VQVGAATTGPSIQIGGFLQVRVPIQNDTLVMSANATASIDPDTFAFTIAPRVQVEGSGSFAQFLSTKPIGILTAMNALGVTAGVSASRTKGASASLTVGTMIPIVEGPCKDNYKLVSLAGFTLAASTTVASSEVSFSGGLQVSNAVFRGAFTKCDFDPNDNVLFTSKIAATAQSNLNIDASMKGVIPDLFGLGVLSIGDVSITAGVNPTPPWLTRLGFGASIAVGYNCITGPPSDPFLARVDKNACIWGVADIRVDISDATQNYFRVGVSDLNLRKAILAFTPPLFKTQAGTAIPAWVADLAQLRNPFVSYSATLPTGVVVNGVNIPAGIVVRGTLSIWGQDFGIDARILVLSGIDFSAWMSPIRIVVQNYPLLVVSRSKLQSTLGPQMNLTMTYNPPKFGALVKGYVNLAQGIAEGEVNIDISGSGMSMVMNGRVFKFLRATFTLAGSVGDLTNANMAFS